jgi:hypothetical protein
VAVRFDAADDRIYLAATLPDPAITGLTVLGWWRIRVDRDDFTCYYRTSSGGNGTIHTVAAGSTGLGVNVFTGGGSIVDTYANVVDEWFAMAVVDGGAGVTQYVRPAGGSTVSQSGSVTSGIPVQICIGGRALTDAGEFLNGAAAYVRVFADALTQAELEAEWSSGTAVLPAWADWPLAVASDLTDHSGNGRNLTPVGVGPTTESGPPVPIVYAKAGGATAAAAGSGAVELVPAAVHVRSGGAAAFGAGAGSVAVLPALVHAKTGGASAVAVGVGSMVVATPGPIHGRLRAGVPVTVGQLHAGPETTT